MPFEAQLGEPLLRNVKTAIEEGIEDALLWASPDRPLPAFAQYNVFDSLEAKYPLCAIQLLDTDLNQESNGVELSEVHVITITIAILGDTAEEVMYDALRYARAVTRILMDYPWVDLLEGINAAGHTRQVERHRYSFADKFKKRQARAVVIPFRVTYKEYRSA